MRFQVTLGNGSGQGTYGTGETEGEAARIAFAEWRRNFGSKRKPVQAALTTAPDGARGGLGGPDATTDYDYTVTKATAASRVP